MSNINQRIDYPKCTLGGLHEGEPLLNMCLEKSCRSNVLACNACVQENHLNHKYRPIKQQLSSLITELKLKAMDFSLLQDKIEENKQQSLQMLDELMYNFNEQIQYYKSQVNNFYNKENELIQNSTYSKTYIFGLFDKIFDSRLQSKENLQSNLSQLLNLDKERLQNKPLMVQALEQNRIDIFNQIEACGNKIEKSMYDKIAILKSFSKNMEQNILSQKQNDTSVSQQIIKATPLKQIFTVAVSEDKKLIATAGEDLDIRIWDVRRQDCVFKLTDSQILASGGQDKSIKVWKFYKDISPYKDIFIHSEVKSVCYSHNKKMIASTGNDEIIRIWDAFSFYCIANLEGHHGTIWSALFSPQDDFLVSVSIDKTLKLWNLDTFNTVITKNLDNSGENDKIAYSQCGSKIAVGDMNGFIQIYRTSDMKQIMTLDGHHDRIKSVSFIDIDRLVSGSSDCSTRVWDLKTGTCEQVFNGHMGSVNSVEAIGNLKVVSVGSDSTIRIWKL